MGINVEGVKMKKGSIKIKRIRIDEKVRVYVVANVSINIYDILSLYHEQGPYYFRPIKILADGKRTEAILEECEYYGMSIGLNKKLDYYKLIDMELSVVTDAETIKGINLYMLNR